MPECSGLDTSTEDIEVVSVMVMRVGTGILGVGSGE